MRLRASAKRNPEEVSPENTVQSWPRDIIGERITITLNPVPLPPVSEVTLENGCFSYTTSREAIEELNRRHPPQKTKKPCLSLKTPKAKEKESDLSCETEALCEAL